MSVPARDTTEAGVKILDALRTFNFSGYHLHEVNQVIADPSLDLGADLAMHIAVALEDDNDADAPREILLSSVLADLRGGQIDKEEAAQRLIDGGFTRRGAEFHVDR